MATRIVAARSAAEIPVVTPKRAAASMLIVNAVSWDSELCSVICGSPSAWHRAGVRGMQINPRAWVAMKLIMAGVPFSAAPTASPRVPPHPDVQQHRIIGLGHPLDRADAIHMTLHEVAAQPIARP